MIISLQVLLLVIECLSICCLWWFAEDDIYEQDWWYPMLYYSSLIVFLVTFAVGAWAGHAI